MIEQGLLLIISVACLIYAGYLLRRQTRGWLKSILFVTGLGLLGCAPSRPKIMSFVVVVHNQDSYPETAVVSWWHDSTISGVTTLTIPAGGSRAFFMGSMPDGFELDTTAHPAQLGGEVWMTPDYRDCYVFHVHYPSGFTWKQFKTK
jgi:hypothetical protein